MYYIGIDLGGTNIKAGIVDENGNIIYKNSSSTKSEQGAMSVLKSMAKLAFQILDEAGISMDSVESIGIGCPGSVDNKNGIVGFSNNLGWRDVNVRKVMESLTGKAIYLENDANAAAYGEYISGSMKNADNAILITLGTGVGGGIILNGKIFTGSNGMGAELGHMVISMDGKECTCGRKGCFEAYASATALIELTKEIMDKNPESLMWESGKINGQTAFIAAKKGDKAANEVLDTYTKALASGIISLVNIFQPEIVAIGGGVSGSAEELIPKVQEIFNKEVFSRFGGKQSKICKAKLGNDAGLIGAAFLWKNN